MLHKTEMYLARYNNPKSTGSVVKELVKCGKNNCQCLRGKLHGPYNYHYFRELREGKWLLKKLYVPQGRVHYLKRKIQQIKASENLFKTELIEMNLNLTSLYEILSRN